MSNVAYQKLTLKLSSGSSMAVVQSEVRETLRCPWMCFTGSVPYKKILHCTNISFSGHAMAQTRRHTTSKAFKRLKGYLECCKCARLWDFTAQLVGWQCAFAHLRGNFVYGVPTKIHQENVLIFIRPFGPLFSLPWSQHNCILTRSCCKSADFFYLVLVTSIGGKPKPEICFLPGRLRCSC